MISNFFARVAPFLSSLTPIKFSVLYFISYYCGQLNSSTILHDNLFEMQVSLPTSLLEELGGYS